MRTKKHLATGILLALVVSLLPVTAFSAQKVVAGSSCKIYKEKITYKKINFVCLKTGKKLIWSKAVKTSTSQPTPKSAPVQSVSDLYLEKAKISYKAWQENRFSGQVDNLTIKYFYTDTFPKDFLKLFKSEAESSSAYLSQFIDSNQVFNIYFLTEKDESYMDELGLWQNRSYRPGQFSSWRLGDRLNHCEGAAAWYLKGRNESSPSLHGGIAIASKAVTSNFSPWCLDRITTHEMFHAVQDYWLTKKQGNTGFRSQDEYDRVEMPIFREGSAEYVSGMIATKSIDQYLSALKARFKYPAVTTRTSNDLNSASSVASYLKKIEFRSAIASAHEDSYLLGYLFFEYLVSEYGFTKFVELLKSQNRDTPFREAFSSVYGIEIDQGYLQASGHILNGLEYLSK
jgi:hypothetical protein